MCLFVQHDRRRKHGSISLKLQRLHNGEMSCLSMWCFLWLPMYCLYLNFRIAVLSFLGLYVIYLLDLPIWRWRC